MPELGNTPAQIAEYIKSRLDKSDTRTKQALARLDELEQKSDRGSYDGTPIEAKSIGAQFVEADGLKDFADFTSRPSRFSMDIKSTVTSTVADSLIVPTRDTALLLPHRELRIRDLLPTINVTTGSVEYPRLTAGPSAAATVAEGAEKPEAAMTLDLVTVPIRTIAHWIPASRQVLDDAPQLRGLIDTELTYGLKFVEDNQLLNGAGSGTDLSGIYTNATAFAAGAAVVTTPNKIDVLLHAILQNALALLPADAIVLHPADWVSILALKDGEGRYLIANPQERANPSLFGLPVVQSLAMTVGTFLVGAFQASATLYDRWGVRVEVSTEHADFFTRNLVAILCEERLGLAVKRSTGFTKGTFAAAIVDLTS
tara:strand:+ start:4814 stop:5923 length:1110 start_codon:yes stop_codon:yes gene_type:complete